MITHRCKGSLKAGTSIRYEKGWVNSQNAWWMWKTVIDDEWITEEDNIEAWNRRA